MSIHANCPSCGAGVNLAGHLADQRVCCGRCRKPFRVPAAAAGAGAAADAAPPSRRMPAGLIAVALAAGLAVLGAAVLGVAVVAALIAFANGPREAAGEVGA